MKIEHIAIWARDIERLREFYETYFEAKAGERYVNDAKGFSSRFLRFESGARFELMQMDGIEAGPESDGLCFGLAHFAISVGSETRVDQLTARLKADGYCVLDGPRRTGDGYYEATVLDPENNRLEITV